MAHRSWGYDWSQGPADREEWNDEWHGRGLGAQRQHFLKACKGKGVAREPRASSDPSSWKRQRSRSNAPRSPRLIARDEVHRQQRDEQRGRPGWHSSRGRSSNAFSREEQDLFMNIDLDEDSQKRAEIIGKFIQL